MTAAEWILTFEADHVTPEALNYQLPSWPPPDDFPISVNAKGRVISRFADPSWDLSPYAGKTCSLSFGDGDNAALKHRNTRENANLLRLCACWFIWGDRRHIVPNSVLVHHNALKPIFSACSSLESPIPASALSRFDRVVDNNIAPAIPASSRNALINLLHELYGARDILGFTLLAPAQIARLAVLVPVPMRRQTPFIPPRIWLYQTERMRVFLEDFVAHRAKLESLFNVTLDAYVQNYGEHAAGDSNARKPHWGPFRSKGAPGHCVRLGPFGDVARRHGVADLFSRWLLRPGEEWETYARYGVQALAEYFNQVQFVGHHHVLNWSGMRNSEALSLRSSCLVVEDDPKLGRLYSVRGETKKTTQDDDARWVTGPEMEIGVQALRAVAALRMRAATLDPRVPLTPEDRDNPYLVNRGYEPWNPGRFDASRPLWIRPEPSSIHLWRTYCPNLFDEEQLRIQPEDERIARLVEPTLDPEKFAVGKPWHLSPHQYRRTTIVTMASSGEVSLASQQLHAKHLVRQQTVYYNKGFSGLHFNQEFATELIVERYRASARLGKELSEPHWVSPHGEDHKQRMLVRLHHTASIDDIQKDIRKGVSAVRPTLFGVCTRRDRCPYGGWDNYVHCTDCVEALMDSRRRDAVNSMGRTIALKLVDAPAGTPLRSALEGKAKAIEEFLHVTS